MSKVIQFITIDQADNIDKQLRAPGIVVNFCKKDGSVLYQAGRVLGRTFIFDSKDSKDYPTYTFNKDGIRVDDLYYDTRHNYPLAFGYNPQQKALFRQPLFAKRDEELTTLNQVLNKIIRESDEAHIKMDGDDNQEGEEEDNNQEEEAATFQKLPAISTRNLNFLENSNDTTNNHRISRKKQEN